LQRELVLSLASEYRRLRGLYAGALTRVMISFAGLVSPNCRHVVTAPDIWGSVSLQFPLASLLEREIPGVTVHLVNDLVAGGWRYFALLQNRAVQTFALLTISTGIGYQLVNTRRPSESPSVPVSLGHDPVEPRDDAFVCTCGERGHVAAYASGLGAENVMRRWALTHPQAFRASRLFARAEAAIGAMNSRELRERLRRPSVARNALGWVADHDCRERLGRGDANVASEKDAATIAALCLDNRILAASVHEGDAASLCLLDAIVEPVARHLRLELLPRVDRIVLMGGFARAVGAPYLERLAHAIGVPSHGGPIEWALDDDLDGVVGAGIFSAWRASRERPV
jgi:predicted NBD/HSP70 family sugar kinase